MPLTHAEIVTRLQAKLWTATNTQWTSAIIVADGMTPILKKLSQLVPFVTTERHPGDRAVPIRGEYTTDGTTRDIILTDWDFEDLVKISQYDGVEYEVDEEPKEFRNFTQHGKIISLELDDIPDADEDVYIYPQRLHILQEVIGTTDTAGAVSTASVVGDTSLIIKSLGTGTINKYTKVTITTTPADTTEYMVTETATITGNVATVKLTPALVKVNLINDVVTLALADSTLSPALEEVYSEWVAGQLIKAYATNKLPGVTLGASPATYVNMGKDMIAEALRDLSALVTPDRYCLHSRS